MLWQWKHAAFEAQKYNNKYRKAQRRKGKNKGKLMDIP